MSWETDARATKPLAPSEGTSEKFSEVTNGPSACKQINKQCTQITKKNRYREMHSDHEKTKENRYREIVFVRFIHKLHDGF